MNDIEEMRRQVVAHDNAKQHERGLSHAMMDALGAMPVTLTSGPDVLNGCLPVGAPAGGTIKALRDRELIQRAGNQWVRTTLGEAVWANR